MRDHNELPGEITRRQLLRRAMILGGSAMAGTALARLLSTTGGNTLVYAQGLFERVKGLPPEITPNKDFYVVSKNPPGFDPVVNVERWNLEIAGLVSRPGKLTYDTIRGLPSIERYHTLECISNEVGGDLISNAKWRGTALRDVLGQAGELSPKTVRIAFRCADGYSEAIPLADALNPETLLVYEMNGERLPNSHGFPVRLLAPGLFGMKNPKWITKIEAVDHNFQGYWERSGWSDKAVVQTMSKITAPRSGVTVRPGETVELGGVAYAGNRGIRTVEFSPDDGKTWQPAEVKSPLGKHTWVLWAAPWKPPAAGDHRVRVRATDGLGVRQTSVETATLPNGATGHHRIVVRARS
jgi:DMSO/TMAO reductase YedYZ molybdopterin-dependent catalytic subunit